MCQTEKYQQAGVSVPVLKQSVSNHCMMCPPSASLGSNVALLLLKYCEPPPLTPEFSNKRLEGFSREDFPFFPVSS